MQKLLALLGGSQALPWAAAAILAAGFGLGFWTKATITQAGLAADYERQLRQIEGRLKEAALVSDQLLGVRARLKSVSAQADAALAALGPRCGGADADVVRVFQDYLDAARAAAARAP